MDRVFTHGANHLSDTELLAILLKSGDARMSALDVAHNVLHRVDNCLIGLGRMTAFELAAFAGMGRAKAAAVVVAIELGRRRGTLSVSERPMVAKSSDAYELLKPVIADLTHEEFWLLLLDRGNRLLFRERISSGGLHGTVADPKMIFAMALERKASSVVLAHNHPSGQLRPSEEDIRLTKKLVEGGRFLDIAVQDHLIVSVSGWYSFADQGMLN